MFSQQPLMRRWICWNLFYSSILISVWLRNRLWDTHTWPSFTTLMMSLFAHAKSSSLSTTTKSSRLESTATSFIQISTSARRSSGRRRSNPTRTITTTRAARSRLNSRCLNNPCSSSNHHRNIREKVSSLNVTSSNNSNSIRSSSSIVDDASKINFPKKLN